MSDDSIITDGSLLERIHREGLFPRWVRQGSSQQRTRILYCFSHRGNTKRSDDSPQYARCQQHLHGQVFSGWEGTLKSLTSFILEAMPIPTQEAIA